MIFPKLAKNKTFKDPIHDIIIVDYQVIADLINCREFQRLHFIHQLGGAFFVYPTASHTRFSHSLGTYEVARKIVNTNKILSVTTEEERVFIIISALLHDLGHSLLSHAFEFIHPIPHEEYTIDIILKDTEINKVLREVDVNLPQIIADIIQKTHPRKLLVQLISSQLDADRMDYLLRDAYFSGLPYGIFDINRIILMIDIHNDLLVFKKGAISAIENFFMGRYHMYQQLYFHPSSLSFEVLAAKWFKRLKELKEQNYSFKNNYSSLAPLFSSQRLTVEEHYHLVDNVFFPLIEASFYEEDAILKDLAGRYLKRTFLPFRISEKKEDSSNSNKDYNYMSLEISQVLYKRKVSGEELIYIYDDIELKELTVVSPIVRATVDSVKKTYITFFS